MLCGLKTAGTSGQKSEIPDDSGKKLGTDWVLPKITGSGRVAGTRQALVFREVLESF